MEGILQIWTNVFMRWQDKYFILHDDILTYCEHKNGNALGQIHMKIAGIQLIPSEPQQFIINTGTTEIQIKANSILEKQQWINSLQQSQNKCQKHISLDYKLQELLTKLWISFATFDETLNILSNRVTQTTKELIDKIIDIGQQLKCQLTIGIDLIQEEKHKHQESSNTVYESFNELDYDDTRLIQSVPIERRVQTEEFNQTPPPYRPQLTISVSEAIQQIRHSQPIKYKFLMQNSVFQKLKISTLKERDFLHYKQDPKEKLQFLPFLKSVIGKDLTRIPVPLIFHQPLSALQMIVQSFDYFDQIKQASNSDDSLMRLAHIIAFSLGKCAFTLDTQKKPFNPLLGETYEFVTQDYWIIAEQVSHHPPISAIYCEGPEFIFFTQVDASVKFGGTCVKLINHTSVHIHLKRYDEHYSFNVPNMLVKNLIFGEKYFEHVGDIEYKNHTTGEIGILHLKERNWDDSNYTNVFAEIKDRNGIVRKKLKGFYNSEVYIDSKCIWQKKNPPKENYWYYGYSHLILQANYLNSENIMSILNTDSRLRPDIVALEHGWKELGQDEKQRLEEKQREARKVMEANNQEHIPRYFAFETEPYTHKQMWLYKGNFWDDRREVFDIY